MERITATDVHAAFAALQAIHQKALNWEIEEGSPVNGKAWRILRKGTKRDIFGQQGFIGNNAREAYNVVKWMIVGVQIERGTWHIRDDLDNRA